MVIAVTLFISFLLLVGMTLTLTTVALALGEILIKAAEIILSFALLLPGFKTTLLNELPNLEMGSCSKMTEYIRMSQNKRLVADYIDRTLKSKNVGISEFISTGKLELIYGDANGFQVLLLDAGKLNNDPGPIGSSGPVYIYSSVKTSIPLHVSSKTAVVFCNEAIDSRGWSIDAPVIVASSADEAREKAELKNTQTDDHTVKLVPFDRMRGAVKGAIMRALNGDPMFGGPVSTEVPRTLEIITIPAPSTAAITPPAPLPNPDAPKTDETKREEVPEEFRVQVQNEVGKLLAVDDHPADLTSAKLAWQKTNCGLGWVYVRCYENFEAKDLQHFINNSIKKKDGKFVAHKKFGPLTLDFEITNLRLFFENHKLGALVDVAVLNNTAVGDKHDNTLNDRLHENGGPRLGDKLKDLAKMTISAKNTYQNVKRGVTLAIPNRIEIKDAVVTVGSIEYDKETGFFHIADAKLKDFVLQIPNRDIPENLGGFKPFIMSSVGEFLKPYFKAHPVFDLQKVRVYGMKLGWFVMESVTINGEKDTVDTSLKLGWGGNK